MKQWSSAKVIDYTDFARSSTIVYSDAGLVVVVETSSLCIFVCHFVRATGHMTLFLNVFLFRFRLKTHMNNHMKNCKPKWLLSHFFDLAILDLHKLLFQQFRRKVLILWNILIYFRLIYLVIVEFILKLILGLIMVVKYFVLKELNLFLNLVILCLDMLLDHMGYFDVS